MVIKPSVFLAQYNPSLIISIERPGQAVDGLVLQHARHGYFR